MYSNRGRLILGFHGTDRETAESVVSGKSDLKPSANDYDWLGHGIYFWENSLSRATNYAEELKSRRLKLGHKEMKPSVVGAVIDIGNCLDLLDYENLAQLREAYDVLVSNPAVANNIPTNRIAGNSDDLLLRNLDCAVIETLHGMRHQMGKQPYDSVRGVFWEGKELYPGAGFREKDHIQICIRNPNCIKGFFVPQSESRKHPAV